MIKFAIGLLVFAVSVGGVMLVANRHRMTTERLLVSLSPIWVWAIAVSFLLGVVGNNYNIWDAGRITPSVALAYGLSPYSTIDHGTVHTTMYPPLWAVAYVPTGIASSPTVAMIAAYMLTMLFTFLPAAGAILATRSHWPVRLGCFGVFVFFTSRLSSLAYSCYDPHADAPALGAACAAVMFGLFFARSERQVFLVMAAIFSVVSVGCKQTMLPLLPGFVVWFLVSRGVRSTLQYSAWVLGVGAFVVAICGTSFGIDALVFNLFVIPSRCAWVGSFPANIFNSIYATLNEGLLPGLLLIVAASVAAHIRKTFTRDSWLVFLFFAVVLFPAAVLQHVKIGRDANTLAPTTYFIALAACVALSDLEAALRQIAHGQSQHRRYQAILVASALAVLSVWSLGLLKRCHNELYPSANANQQAFEFLVLHPGAAYFPAHPLAHLLAEGELFHFSYAVFDREYFAGIPISDQQRNLFPFEREIVCWQGDHGNHFLREKYFPMFDVVTPRPELPLFECYMRAPSLSGTETPYGQPLLSFDICNPQK